MVKYRMFRSQHSEMPASAAAEHDYVKHIWERSRHRWVQGLPTDGSKFGPFDYIGAALSLLDSMKRHGFDPDYAIPVDQNGDILNGAHRIACALSLGKNVILTKVDNKAWAPPWGSDWFLANGFALDYVNGLMREMMGLVDGGAADSRGHAGCGGASRQTA
jgi:hypothetical protein